MDGGYLLVSFCCLATIPLLVHLVINTILLSATVNHRVAMVTVHPNALAAMNVKMVNNLLGRPDVCLRQTRLVIGQFGCSGLPPSDAKGKPTIENERKIISTQVVQLILPADLHTHKSEVYIMKILL